MGGTARESEYGGVVGAGLAPDEECVFDVVGEGQQGGAGDGSACLIQVEAQGPGPIHPLRHVKDHRIVYRRCRAIGLDAAGKSPDQSMVGCLHRQVQRQPEV